LKTSQTLCLRTGKIPKGLQLKPQDLWNLWEASNAYNKLLNIVEWVWAPSLFQSLVVPKVHQFPSWVLYF
jgi:hypothetical protein